ncbi:MAG: response regulator [Candidatus Omnitrophica bacterium]|nr:response regulator [Candidatus Omnitrophota bacterium]
MNERRTILICDDEEGVRESLNLILGEEYKVDFVNNGNEALQYLSKTNPDLVIMDIKMPQKNGLETLKELRQKKPNLKVIMVTGYQSVETAAEASKCGILEYITKPFESSLVKETVQKALKSPNTIT